MSFPEPARAGRPLASRKAGPLPVRCDDLGARTPAPPSSCKYRTADAATADDDDVKDADVGCAGGVSARVIIASCVLRLTASRGGVELFAFFNLGM